MSLLKKHVTCSAIVLLLAGVAACNPVGLPSTRSLENGAEAMLTSANSYELAGHYISDGTPWAIDIEFERPDRRHVTVVSQLFGRIEATIIGTHAYFRGEAFLAFHLGGDPEAQRLAHAAGSAWWEDTVTLVPNFPNLTDGAAFRANFLGAAVNRRIDDQSVNGVDAVELSGDRADVYIAASAPYHLLRIHLNVGAVVDNIAAAELTFTNVDKKFGIAEPKDVIDFANWSTLPPVYTVLSVDTSGCASPCVVAAKVKNVGGTTGARAPSTVTFTMTDPVSKQALGACTVTVQPDVGYNSTTAVSCTISATPVNGAVVAASAENPGRP